MSDAGRAVRHPGARRRVLRAVRVSVMLPFAMFAVMAMSQLPPAVVNRVVVVDGAVYIGFDPSVGARYWAMSRDGWNFEWITKPNARLADPSADHATADPALPVTACVPSEPSTCFRTVPKRIGVERSDDAGLTWRSEWGLTDQQVTIIGHGAGTFPRDFMSKDIAITDDGVGFRVYVANGADGFSERAPDGTWDRVPTHFVGAAERASTPGSDIPPPAVPAAWQMTWMGAVAWAGFAAFGVLLALLLPFRDTAAPRKLGRRTGLAILSGALWLPSLIASSTTPQPSWDASGLNGDIGFTGMMVVGWAAVAFAAGAAIAVSVLKAPIPVRDAAFGWTATAGLVAAIAGGFVSVETSGRALTDAAAVAAAGAVYAIARWRFARVSGKATR